MRTHLSKKIIVRAMQDEGEKVIEQNQIGLLTFLAHRRLSRVDVFRASTIGPEKPLCFSPPCR